MPTNVLLIRWEGGWHEATPKNTDLETLLPRRIEGTLGLGAAQSTQEVDRIADKQLDLFKVGQVVVEGSIEPRFDDKGRTPYIGFQVGDKVSIAGNPEYVINATVTEDEEGAVSYAIDWGDPIIRGKEAFAQWLKKMANGTLGGQAKPATPIALVPSRKPGCCDQAPTCPCTETFKFMSNWWETQSGPVFGEVRLIESQNPSPPTTTPAYVQTNET